MDWEKLSKTNRILLMILPPIVLIVLFSSIYMLPTLDNIKKTKKMTKKNIQEDIEKANIIVSKYEDLKALNEKLQKKNGVFKNTAS